MRVSGSLLERLQASPVGVPAPVTILYLMCAGTCDDPAAGQGEFEWGLAKPCQGYSPIISEKTQQNVVKGVVTFEGSNQSELPCYLRPLSIPCIDTWQFGDRQDCQLGGAASISLPLQEPGTCCTRVK